MTAQTIARCAFCSALGVTDEHIIADWIRRMFPATDKHLRFRGARSADGTSRKFRRRLPKSIAFSAKTRKVCATCNDGWMSECETQVQPILTPLINGAKLTLRLEDLFILAGWIVKTTMTADTLYPESSAIPQADRAAFMNTRRPPDNWQIYLARHSSKEWETGLDHIGIALHRAANTGKLKDVINTQSTTIGIGKLLVHVFSSTLPGVQFEPGEFRTSLCPLWPLSRRRFWLMPRKKLVWPPSNALSDGDVERLGRHLYTHFNPPPARIDL